MDFEKYLATLKELKGQPVAKQVLDVWHDLAAQEEEDDSPYHVSNFFVWWGSGVDGAFDDVLGEYALPIELVRSKTHWSMRFEDGSTLTAIAPWTSAKVG